jgi:UDP-3-O-[3-hydroxymyristoyl] glucosamine N-acyltransferase
MTYPAPVITLGQVAALFGASVAPARAGLAISGVATLKEAGPTEISFLGSDAFIKRFQETKAAAILVQKNVKLPGASQKTVLLVDDADLAISKLLELYAQPIPRPPIGIDPQARVDGSAIIEADVAIGPFCVIGARARLGRGVVVHPHVYIGDDVTIGDGSEIYPNVTIRERITIGNRVIIHAGSVLGTDGFGYRWDGTKHAKIPQIGTVIVEDDVEIGSCVCIDRAKFSSTRIGRGTKIDNLVQIAHNVVIGPHCIIVGQAGVAGSATLGAGVVLGGQVAVRDHITLGEGAMVAACGAVAEDVPPKTVVSGMPALPHRQNLREQAALRRLPEMVVQVRKLQDELNKLHAEIEKHLPPESGK